MPESEKVRMDLQGKQLNTSDFKCYFRQN
jgi:hypothetical protein